jgi:hypothetical protein
LLLLELLVEELRLVALPFGERDVNLVQPLLRAHRHLLDDLLCQDEVLDLNAQVYALHHYLVVVVADCDHNQLRR